MPDAAIAVVTGADGYVALEIIKQLLEKVSPGLSAVFSPSNTWHVITHSKCSPHASWEQSLSVSRAVVVRLLHHTPCVCRGTMCGEPSGPRRLLRSAVQSRHWLRPFQVGSAQQSSNSTCYAG
jgi:hypothetical protein